MAHLIKNEHQRYEVRFKGADGKIKSKSTGKTNRKEAQQFIKDARIKELESAAELGLLTQDVVSSILYGRKMTIEKAMVPWEQWLREQSQSEMSIKNALVWVTAWANARHLMHRPIMGVTRHDIDEWINDPNSKSKAGTRRAMLSAVKSLFKFASGSGMVMGNQAALVRVDLGALSHEQKETEKKPCFTDEEVERLLLATAPGGSKEDLFWHAAVAIGRWTGLRLGDIATLEWDSFKSPGRIAVWTRKRDKRIELPLEPPALLHAVQGISRDDERYVFPGPRLTAQDPTLRATLSTQFASLLEHVGITGKSFHCLRATYISACDAAGIKIEHIARSVGHSNPFTTQGYIR